MRNTMTRLSVNFLHGTSMLVHGLALSISKGCIALQSRLLHISASLDRPQSQVRPSPPSAWRGPIARRGRSDGT